MLLRTVALALTFSFGLTGLAEAKAKPAYYTAKAKRGKYKPYKAGKVKRNKFHAKARKHS